MLSYIVPAAAQNTEQPDAAQDAEQQVTPELSAETVGEFLDSFFAMPEVKPHYVGASVVIVQDDEIIAQKGYGYADLANETPVDPESTLFRVASVSKSFTAVAIMQLVEQGKIDLQENIETYLNGIEIDNPFDTPVTVEHLLLHETGFEIRDPQPGDLHGDFEKFVEMEEYIRAHFPPVVREPGTSYMYDNFAHLLLGYIVQNVSGQEYEDYMNDHIFAPLGMENSGFLIDEDVLGKMATGYDMTTGEAVDPYTYTPTIMPHGGMYATAEDIGKFMIAFLQAEKAAEGNLLSPETYESMIEYRSAIHPLLPNTTYGFEAASQLPQAGSSAAVITKAGDLPGNSSLMLFIPEQRVGVFLTYNKMGVLRELFYPMFMGSFFPQYAMPAVLGPYEEVNTESLQKFAGLYSDLRLRSIVSNVQVQEDGTVLISDSIIGPRALIQVDENLFMDELTYKLTAFTIDELSGAVYLKEPYLNPLGYARKGNEPAGFQDVTEVNPYSEFIHALQSLGYYPNDANAEFQPEALMSRSEVVRLLLTISGINGTETQSEDYVFTDIADHEAATYIQAAVELGMVQGVGGGKFAPDRAATRQEVAVMIWNVMRLQYPDALFAHIALGEDVADWAAPAVKMAIALGLHGPEVQLNAEGAAIFKADETINNQEVAAILYKLLTQPTDQIVTMLQQQLQQEQQEQQGQQVQEEQQEQQEQQVQDAEQPNEEASQQEKDPAQDSEQTSEQEELDEQEEQDESVQDEQDQEVLDESGQDEQEQQPAA